MPKSFSVVLNSYFSYNPVNTDHATRQYAFDWSSLPEGQYKVTFSFISQLVSIGVATIPVFQVCIPDLNLQNNMFTASNITSSQVSTIGTLGHIYPLFTSSLLDVATMRCEAFTNPSIICNKPTNPVFTVQIRNIDTTNSLVANAFNNTGYLLILNFDAI